MKKPTKLRKGVPKGEKPLTTAFRLSSTTYFLTYKGFSEKLGRNITKNQLLDYLLNQNPRDRKLLPVKYLICQQMYDSGQPHFHAILIYSKRKQILDQDVFDFLDIHPNIQTMRNMKAALEYVYKQDSYPLTNMDIIHERRVARAKDTSSLYSFLYEQMIKDPLGFDVFQYCQTNHLSHQIYKANYPKAVHLLMQIQKVCCNKLLTEKPGFKIIDRPLIEQKLSPSDLKIYDSWAGYSIIVDHLNKMTRQRGLRDPKSSNLLITGPPNVGKSALVWHPRPRAPFNPISAHCSVYPMGMKDWFPQYKSGVYHCIYWNEAKLSSYTYDVILQLLDGSPVMLPAKGGGHKKVDNPLVIMTSNMTLEQMIHQKFSYNKAYQALARANLGARITNVVVPRGYDLFLLQQLLIPEDCFSRK